MYSLGCPLRRLSLSERIPGGIEVWLLEFDAGLSVPDSELALLSPEERVSKDFIRHWVAKESVLKALGLGISEHLQSVSILPRDDEAYEIAHDFPEWPEIQAWRLPVPDGYAAALAFQTHDWPSAQGKSHEVSRLTSRLPLPRLDRCQGRAAYPQVCDQFARQIDHA